MGQKKKKNISYPLLAKTTKKKEMIKNDKFQIKILNPYVHGYFLLITDLSLEASILDIKTKIEKQFFASPPVQKQILFFGGKIMATNDIILKDILLKQNITTKLLSFHLMVKGGVDKKKLLRHLENEKNVIENKN